MQLINIHRFQSNLNIGSLLVLTLGLLFNSSLAAAAQLKIDTPQLPLFGFVDENGKNTGLYYEVLNRIAEEAGFTYTNQIVPFARMITELERGETEFSAFFRSDANDKLTIQLSPLFTLKNIVIGLKGNHFESLASLHGKQVARVRGAYYDDAFDKNDAIKKVDTVDFTQSVKMLMNKRVDAIIGPELGLLFSARQLGSAKADFGDPLVVNTRDVWGQFSKTAADAQKIAALQAAITKLLQDGTIQALVKKYLGD